MHVNMGKAEDQTAMPTAAAKASLPVRGRPGVLALGAGIHGYLYHHRTPFHNVIDDIGHSFVIQGQGDAIIAKGLAHAAFTIVEGDVALAKGGGPRGYIRLLSTSSIPMTTRLSGPNADRRQVATRAL